MHQDLEKQEELEERESSDATENVPDGSEEPEPTREVEEGGGPDDIDQSEDVEIVVRDSSGTERVLRSSDVAELYEKVSEYEKKLSERSVIEQYAPLLNYVANDELANRVILYRMQGGTPAQIVSFLYQHFVQNNMIDPETGNPIDSPEQNKEQVIPSREVEQLKGEVDRLRGYLETQNVVQHNASLLLRESEELGLTLEDSGDYTKILGEISRDLFGDPLYIVRNQLNAKQARVVLGEMKERLGGKGVSDRSNGRIKVGIRKKQNGTPNPPRQIPSSIKSGGSGEGKTSLPKEWSFKNSELAYKHLFGE